MYAANNVIIQPHHISSLSVEGVPQEDPTKEWLVESCLEERGTNNYISIPPTLISSLFPIILIANHAKNPI